MDGAILIKIQVKIQTKSNYREFDYHTRVRYIETTAT